MKRTSFLCAVALVLSSTAFAQTTATSAKSVDQTSTALEAAPLEWERVAPGLDYDHVIEGSMDLHVVRVDLLNDAIRVISSRQSDYGTRVSEFAKRTRALVAINGDYFDKVRKPIGLAIGPCGQWVDTKDTSREGVAAFGDGRAEIRTQTEVMDPPESWITSAVSGWPMLVRGCHALTSAELPGSDGFTRSPHGRTAVGLSKDGNTAYFVVADGRRPGVPGLTLGQLGAWMSSRLGVCSAINLDGGGSTAMWVKDRIVNKPSDGSERRVGDHFAVISSDTDITCDVRKEKAALAALRAATAKAGEGAAKAKVFAEDINARATITTSVPAAGTTSAGTTSTAPTSTAPPR